MPGPGDGFADDERLRLAFLCCHPVLPFDAKVALTLRMVCGLSTAEVARTLLVPEPAMDARIKHARTRLRLAGILSEHPPAGRVQTVLDVVYLIFSTGHTAPSGTDLVRCDLVESAVDLGRRLHRFLPTDAEVTALLALMLLIDSRRAARVSPDGKLVLLQAQDRTLWDYRLIREGKALLTDALSRRSPTRYAVEAAIAAVHAEARTWTDTDWTEIIALYDVLLRMFPSHVVELNRAIAIGLRDGPAAGLRALEPLTIEPGLATYGYLSAARADFLRQLGRWEEAADAYEEALALTANEVERAFLTSRLDEVQDRLDDVS
ncbi:RNA polymerase sigma-70 factor (ECF subfamily) [Kribbella amoyensis]|uniref:RNA polymerase sigma-70 factor (ECF subfamily) n=1 Tax=Kribbella amoyensis TaxID=996641 RepID=A0A561B8E7_9ACTN|nr:DUF6596 domain-containing protein [Kribbella amoyensis]TWD75235.1 RNA polymerase sigma-70 factor (ECF subfamily) [Kribbella amoyensis]